jgi:uncharacterized membrane protein
MKQYFMLFPFILGLFLLASFPVVSSANALARTAQSAINAPESDVAIALEDAPALKQQKKSGFFQKIMEKRLVKKMKKALAVGDDNGGLVAILAYLTWIGFIIALIMHTTGDRTSLGAFHLSQMLGIIITSAILLAFSFFSSFIPILGLVIVGLFGLMNFINWICGVIFAVGEKEKHVPFFGKLFEKAFLHLFE